MAAVTLVSSFTVLVVLLFPKGGTLRVHEGHVSGDFLGISMGQCSLPFTKVVMLLFIIFGLQSYPDVCLDFTPLLGMWVGANYFSLQQLMFLQRFRVVSLQLSIALLGKQSFVYHNFSIVNLCGISHTHYTPSSMTVDRWKLEFE